MTRSEVEEYIREHAAEYLTPDNSGKGYVCPICGSGSGRKGTGVTENPKNAGHFTCWAGCFKNAGIFDIIAQKDGLTDFNEIFDRACQMFGVYPDKATRPKPTPTNAAPSERCNSQAQTTAPKTDDSTTDFSEFYNEARKHLEETEYHRGISLKTLRAYWVGYIPEWRHPKAGANVPVSPRLIIPTNREGYLARDTRKALTEAQSEYKKQRVGRMGIWNVNTISESQQPVFVVEGEIDGLSIIDAGGAAVALCSTTNAKKFIETVTQSKPKAGFILVLDNDSAGQKAKKFLSEELTKLKIPFCIHDIPTQYKDANEFLTADKAAFEDWCKQGFSALKEKLKENATQEREEFERESAYSYLGDFLQTLQESREGKAIPTGFSQLDALLDGGLYPGLYFVGALSSLGKTSFVLQVTDNIAQSGRCVLFFSLEMARSELIAKSLSRLTRQFCGDNPRLAKTTRGILRADFNPAEHKIFMQAVEEYSRYAGNIFISEGIGDIGVREIKQKLDRFMRFKEGIPPVIMIDYAQILAPTDIRATDKQNTDKNVLELKRISRDYQIPVLAISSFNRENYTEPVNMASFKESGAIEYSSDCLIGLQYSDWDYQKNEKGIYEKESEHKTRVRERLDVITALAKRGMPIDIELKILKNRNGAKDKINMQFSPMFNLFTVK